MRRGSSTVAERDGVVRVDSIATHDLRWFFREQPILDYGVDAHVEIVASDQLVSGRLIGLQIKSGDSQFLKVKRGIGWTFRSDTNHLAYWLGHSLPIVVVVVDPDGSAYWQLISTETVTETKSGKSFTITIPRSQPFGVEARDRLLGIAGSSAGVLDLFPQRLVHLSPDAVGPLQRAFEIDALAAARLAERLVEGRATPGMTAASLTAAGPQWLVRSVASGDLWMSVGGYATEHGYSQEAAAAFVRAAETVGPRAGRAWAFAGLSLAFSDGDVAGRHLGRAHDAGAVLLADVGLAILAIPEDDARAPEIPGSVSAATDFELNAEPTVLNFLGEAALRRGDLNASIRFRERAVEHSGRAGSGLRLALADSIWRRELADGNRTSEGQRRAVAHIRAAIEQRRRWDGPSPEALALLLDLYITIGDFPEAVKAALPVSMGGTARDIEAESEDVARRGALAAVGSGNRTAYSYFISMLSDGPARREVEAHTIPDDAVAESRAVWTALLGEATDNAMAARCIARLAHLGVWTDEAESLADRSIMTPDTIAVLRASCSANSGDTVLGIAKLRELSAREPLAGLELVKVVEDSQGVEDAIIECGQQLERWRSPMLRATMIGLLRRAGRDEHAAELARRDITDDSLPEASRLERCRWYVAYLGSSGRFADAADAARTGLAIVEDPNLAWNFMSSLYQDGQVGRAREALRRYRPEPVSDDEIHLWVQLQLGEKLAVESAATMVDVIERMPDGDLRDAVISVLIREVKLAPQDPTIVYDPAVVAAAAAHLDAMPGT